VSPPRVSIVVPIRNGREVISECIEALLAQDFPAGQREILVVDNGSTDRTAEVVRSYPVTYLSEPRRGVSNARNRGIEAARGEIVALLDGDCVPNREWLRELLEPFEEPAVGCVAGELGHGPIATAAQRQSARILGNWQRYATSASLPYLVTANTAFRRAVLDRVGRFDPRMTRAQDVDFGRRLNELGDVRVVYRPGASALHSHPASQRAFFRQQLGWAHGAGLLEAKRRSLRQAPNDPPRLRPLLANVRGAALVLRERARGCGEAAWLEEAWFNLLRSLAWWLGARAGLLRGRLRFRRRGGSG